MSTTSKFYQILPILIVGLSMPISLFMWLGNLAFSKLTYNDTDFDSADPISPQRWLFSILVPTLMMLYGYRRNSVNTSGAALGLLMGIILSIANHAFLVALATFFFTSSRATKVGQKMKKKIESDFKEGGQRNWAQVLCNGGMGTQLALLYLLDCGSGEWPVDFAKFYRSSWLGMGVMAAFACCNGDTWASELGTVFSKGDPYLITTREKVPRGTNGGVSIIGLVVSALGGLVVGLSYYLTVIYTVEYNQLQMSPPQWPIILVGGIAGLLGSVLDSLLGATLQYSGQTENGAIVEHPGKNIRHICGHRILDNHSVNLISSILTGIIVPVMARRFWLLF